MILFYNILLALLSPLLPIYFFYRKKIGKENISRFYEKRGENYHFKKTKKLIWFNCVSVGELISITPLIKEISQEGKYQILVTSTTLTSSKIAEKTLAKHIIHQFSPIDKIKFVKRFLKTFSPDLAIFVEAELWPNLLNQTKKQNISLILLNARITKRKDISLFFYKIFAKSLLSKFTLILAQNQNSLENLQSLNLDKTKLKTIGNLKYDSPPLIYDEKELKNLINSTKNRLIFLAASTHPKEEEIIARTHKLLKDRYPNILTIIVPRHPNRVLEIETLLKDKNLLSTTIRSRREKITKTTDIYLADTIGELGLFYKLSNISLIAGSFTNIGGHNPLEAMRLGSIPITGPIFHNFNSLYNELLEIKATIIAKNVSHLEEIIIELIESSKLQRTLKENSQKFLKDKKNITINTYTEIKKHLPINPSPLAGEAR